MRIMKEDLGVKPFKLQKFQELFSAQKENRLVRSSNYLICSPILNWETWLFYLMRKLSRFSKL